MSRVVILALLLLSGAFAPAAQAEGHKTFDLSRLRFVAGDVLWFESPTDVEVVSTLDLDPLALVREKKLRMRGIAEIARMTNLYQAKRVTLFTLSGSGRHKGRWTRLLDALLRWGPSSLSPPPEAIEFRWTTVAENGGDVLVSFKVTRKKRESKATFMKRARAEFDKWIELFPPKKAR